MTERLEEISDQDVMDACAEQLARLSYELGESHNRVQDSLRRMNEMDARYRPTSIKIF